MWTANYPNQHGSMDHHLPLQGLSRPMSPPFWSGTSPLVHIMREINVLHHDYLSLHQLQGQMFISFEHHLTKLSNVIQREKEINFY